MIPNQSQSKCKKSSFGFGPFGDVIFLDGTFRKAKFAVRVFGDFQIYF
jgi:hypothetical protein